MSDEEVRADDGAEMDVDTQNGESEEQPQAASPFEGLAEDLRLALEGRGFEGLTPVQDALIQSGSAGRDLRVQSRTGSGKTVGLGITMAGAVREAAADDSELVGPVALVVTPTRELASQVAGELGWLYGQMEGVRLASVTGGVPIYRDRSALGAAPQVLVGTPGRLVDHLRSGQLDLSSIRELVLDEADQMLDMGFREDLETILEAASGEHRTHLVSATFPPGIEALAERYQQDALLVEGSPAGEANADIRHVGHLVRPNERYAALVNMLLLVDKQRVLVFVERRSDAADLALQLEADGFRALPISGDLVQSQRDRALNAFRSGNVHVLVATDVAARGIDVPDVALVVQTAPPIDPETYTHRSGRTGRAGKAGRSVVFSPPRRRRAVERLVNDAGADLHWEDVPGADEVEAAVRERDRLVLRERIEKALEGDKGEPWSEEARALLEEHDPTRLVGALLSCAAPERRTRGRDVGSFDAPGGQKGPRGKGAPRSHGAREGGAPSAGSVRFFINWGSNQGANPARVLAAACRRGEVDGESIGAISVHPNATTFDVSAEVAEAFEARAGRRDPRDPHTMIRRDRGPGGPRGRGGRRRRRGYGARRRSR